MIKCSECGYENMDGLDYCDGCGAKLAAAAAAAPEAAAPAPAPEPEKPAEAAAPAEEPKPSEAPTGEIKPEAAPASPAAPAPAAPAAAVAAFKASLKIVRGSTRKDQVFPLEDGNNLVGRWDPETGSFPEVDLDADDPEAKISRKHALIRIADGKVTVEDIGSLNGTYVNRGARLQPGSPVELKTGDEIIIGKTFLKLMIDPIS
ncbi:MAG TPA: FHA domain-containing protein [Candidatus Binataceae bacterium]|nr:FHA domain-containing protein [Candidatus Binataceae bacterium]